jgi:hypothetical protein
MKDEKNICVLAPPSRRVIFILVVVPWGLSHYSENKCYTELHGVVIEKYREKVASLK